jgi:hypothetical protein
VPPGAPGWAPHCKAQLELGTVAPTCSLACTRTSELMSSTDWQVCALRIVARVPRPAALVCHALRRGARHHVGYAALAGQLCRFQRLYFNNL